MIVMITKPAGQPIHVDGVAVVRTTEMGQLEFLTLANGMRIIVPRGTSLEVVFTTDGLLIDAAISDGDEPRTSVR